LCPGSLLPIKVKVLPIAKADANDKIKVKLVEPTVALELEMEKTWTIKELKGFYKSK